MGEMTVLLQRLGAGDEAAREPLYRRLYPELMRLARGQLVRAGTISLDATALLHEAYLRLAEGQHLPDANRRVFFGYAAKVMHSVIVDYARERGAQKRGGGAINVTLSRAASEPLDEQPVLGVDAAMSELRVVDERAFRVVEMRYFAGMKEEEIASVLDVSLATVRRDWRRARAFLYERLR